MSCKRVLNGIEEWQIFRVGLPENLLNNTNCEKYHIIRLHYEQVIRYSLFENLGTSLELSDIIS